MINLSIFSGMKKKSILLINLLFIGMIAVGGYQYWNEQKQYQEAEDRYRIIRDECIRQEESDTQQTQQKQETPDTAIRFNYQKAQSRNQEIVGYICLPDSAISYPIVRHCDNTFYLTHDAYRSYSIYGAIFMDSGCSGDLDNRHSIIYGHHMDDGSMFADLTGYQDQAFAKSHQFFTVFNREQKEQYRVVSSFETEPDNPQLYRMGFQTEKETEQWIRYVLSASSINYHQPLNSTDKTIILSTCTNRGDQRSVVVLKQIQEI